MPPLPVELVMNRNPVMGTQLDDVSTATPTGMVRRFAPLRALAVAVGLALLPLPPQAATLTPAATEADCVPAAHSFPVGQRPKGPLPSAEGAFRPQRSPGLAPP